MSINTFNNIELYKLLFEHSTSHMWVRDMEGKYLLVNQSFSDFLSLKKQDIIGKTNFELLPHKIAEDFAKDDQVVIQEKRPIIKEVSNFYKKKECFFLVVKFPLLDEKKNIYAIAGCVTDISKEKMFSKSLQQKENVLSSVIQSMGEGIVFFNSKGKLEFMNEEAEKIFRPLGPDKPPKELLLALNFFPLKKKEKEKNPTQKFLPWKLGAKGIEIKNLELEVRGVTSPQSLQISMTSTLVKNHKGAVLGTVLTFRDITERNLLIETLKKQAHELKLKHEALEQFSYFMSHDLREPLRTINSFVHILQEELADNINSSVQNNIRIIRESGQQVNHMICDLVKFCEVGSHIAMGSVNLNNCLKKALGFLKVLLEESQAKIHWAVLPHVKGNETSLVLLFQNLIINAVKFQNNSIPEIFITLEKKGRAYIIGVKDNGIGIESRYIKKIFVPFKRIHSNQSYRGSGIGLALCKKIIEVHEGKIWVESKIGEGSHFKFSLKENLV